MNSTLVLSDNASLVTATSSLYEDYDYGYHLSPTCQIYDFVIEALLIGFLCAFGFVGNSLSTICLLRDGSKSATPFLLVSLNFADTLFLIAVVWVRVITSVQETFPEEAASIGYLKPYIGKYGFPCAMVAETGAIYMTVLVTVNRYLAVCRPYAASDTNAIRRQARLHIALVAAFSVLFNVTRFFEYQIEEIEDSGLHATPTWLYSNLWYQIIYSTVMYFLIMFLIPLISLVILNYNLMTTLRRTRRKRESWRSRSSRQNADQTEQSNSRSEDEITRMLIVVVLVFVFCQSPAFITQALPSVLSKQSLYCPFSYFYYVRVSDLLVVANSSLNFVIYCFCSRRFRTILTTLVGCQARE